MNLICDNYCLCNFFTAAARIPSQDPSLIVQEIIRSEEDKREFELPTFTVLYISRRIKSGS